MKPACIRNIPLFFVSVIGMVTMFAGLQQAIACPGIRKVDTRYLVNAEVVFRGTVIKQKSPKGTDIDILKVEETYKGKTRPLENIIESPEILEEGQTYIIGADREEIVQEEKIKTEQPAPLSILTWSPSSCSSGSTAFNATTDVIDRVRFVFRKELNIREKDLAALIGRIITRLVYNIEGSDEELKYRAEEEFSRYRIAEAADPLLQLMRKKTSYEVKILTIESLGLIKENKAVPDLISFLKDKNPKIAKAAADALGRIKDPQAVTPLITELQQNNQDIAESAARALSFIADPISEPALIQAFQDKNINYQTRMWIASALGELKSQKALPYLIEAFEKEKQQPQLRSFIASALGKIKDPIAVQRLIEALKDKDSSLRNNVARVLEQLKDNRSVVPLVEALFHEQELSNALSYPDDRAEALCAFKQQKKMISTLLKKYKIGKGHYRANTIWTLGCIGGKGHKALFIAALNDNYDMVRRSAAEALVQTGEAAVLSLVVKLLKDEDFGVGFRVAEVLCKSKHKKKLLEILLKKHKANNEPIGIYTASLLGCMKAPEFVPLLIKTLKYKNRRTREGAAWALGSIGNSAAIPHLIELLNDKNDKVQRAAFYALQNFNDVKAKLALRAFNDRQ